MELTLFGLNHTSAPLEVRERWAQSATDSRKRLETLRDTISPSEHLILSTCNRTEFYSRLPRAQSPIADQPDISTQRSTMARFYLGRDAFKPGDLEHFYLYREQAAIEHLFRLAGGLDSMIIGESEILRQIKTAYGVSQEVHAAGEMFHRLFPAALKVGKRVRTSTGISEGCITPGQAALKLAREALGNLESQAVLLIGSGKIATLTTRAILEAGISRFTVVNRTRERAVALFEKLGLQGEMKEQVIEGVHIAPWDQRAEAMAQASLIISSTASQHPIATVEQVEKTQEAREGRPLVVIDLAVPRDFAPEGKRVPGVQLYNIDDLNLVIQENIRERARHIPEAESIVREQMSAFVSHMTYLRVDPIVRHMVERFEEIRLGELQARIDRFPPDLHDELQEVTRSIVKKLLDFPISRLKSIRNMGGLNDTEIAFLKRVFPLDP